MLMDQQTMPRHRGLGFVTFENAVVMDRVCEIHFHTIKKKKIEFKKIHFHTIKNKKVDERECKKNEHKAIENEVAGKWSGRAG